MTEQQKKFVDYYMQTTNATEAARRAGYSKKSAYSIGGRLLKNIEVSKAIERRLKKMESKRLAETQEVLEHLTAVLRGEITEEVVTASGKKFTVLVREQDRLRAAEMLLKVGGAFKEKVEISGSQLFIETLTKITEAAE